LKRPPIFISFALSSASYSDGKCPFLLAFVQIEHYSSLVDSISVEQSSVVHPKKVLAEEMESTKAPVFFILNNPAICQTRNVKLVKPETFFFFTIITASDAIMQSHCNGMADHKSLFVSNGFALPTRSAEDGRLPEPLLASSLVHHRFFFFTDPFSSRASEGEGELCYTR
jgi:hypothetical protein